MSASYPQPSQQRVDDDRSFASTSGLISSLHSLGFGRPIAAEPLTIRPVNLGRQEAVLLRMVDAFASILDTNDTSVAVALTRTMLADTGTLTYELTVCGSGPPDRIEGFPEHLENSIRVVKPLELLVIHGLQVPLQDHIQVLNHFLEKWSISAQARTYMTRYLATSFAACVARRIHCMGEEFLLSLRDVPNPSSLKAQLFPPNDATRMRYIDQDCKLLDRLRHPSIQRGLHGLQLEHLSALVKEGLQPGQPIYNTSTCDDLHRLLLFLLGDGGYFGHINKVLQAAREGQEAMKTNRWDRSMSRRLSQICTSMTVYGVLLRDFAESSALVDHLKRISGNLALPNVEYALGSPQVRSDIGLWNAVARGDAAVAYELWIKMQVEHLTQLAVIQELLGYHLYESRARGLPVPSLVIRTVISTPTDFISRSAERRRRRDWREVVSDALVLNDGGSEHFTARQAMMLLGYLGEGRSTSAEHVLENANVVEQPSRRDGIFHAMACLATLLSHSQDGPDNEHYISKSRRPTFLIGTSAVNCAGCLSISTAVEKLYGQPIVPGWFLNPSIPPSAPQCHIPEWAPVPLAKGSLEHAQRYLQRLFDSALRAGSGDVHESDMEEDSDYVSEDDDMDDCKNEIDAAASFEVDQSRDVVGEMTDIEEEDLVEAMLCIDDSDMLDSDD